jgi:hypothetical protein
MFHRKKSVRVIIEGPDGPRAMRGVRDETRREVKVKDFKGLAIPDSFLRSAGLDTFILATEVEWPANGNFNEAEPRQTARIPQLHWVADWYTYRTTMRSLNMGALWYRGGGGGAMVKLVATIATTLLLLFVAQTTMSMRGQVARLNDASVVLSGQVARIANGEPPSVSRGSDGSLVPVVPKWTATAVRRDKAPRE